MKSSTYKSKIIHQKKKNKELSLTLYLEQTRTHKQRKQAGRREMSSTAGQVIRCKGNIINSHLLRVFEFCSNFGVLVDLYKERISINLYI